MSEIKGENKQILPANIALLSAETDTLANSTMVIRSYLYSGLLPVSKVFLWSSLGSLGRSYLEKESELQEEV